MALSDHLKSLLRSHRRRAEAGFQRAPTKLISDERRKHHNHVLPVVAVDASMCRRPAACALGLSGQNELVSCRGSGGPWRQWPGLRYLEFSCRGSGGP